MKKWKSKGILLTFIIMFILFVLTFIILPEKKSFSLCPSKLVIGMRCPLCGMGKSFSYLSHGNFKDVLTTNKSAFFFYPLYIFALYLLLVAFFSANGISRLPGCKILTIIQNHSIKIVIVLFILALVVFIFDVLTGSGEKIFDFNYTIYSLFK